MKCPCCNVLLVSASRDRIEIDYCPSCWGIWLDRGELNELIARAQPPTLSGASHQPALGPEPETSHASAPMALTG